MRKAFASLPKNLTTLDLSRNNLSGFKSEALAYALAALPKGLTTLKLSHNELDNFKVEELRTVFAKLPIGLAELDVVELYPALPEYLRGLPKLSRKELRSALAKIPKDWNKHDAIWNTLSDTQKDAIFATTRGGVTINFSDNDLRRTKPQPQPVLNIEKIQTQLNTAMSTLDDLHTRLESKYPEYKDDKDSIVAINKKLIDDVRQIIEMFVQDKNMSQLQIKIERIIDFVKSIHSTNRGNAVEVFFADLLHAVFVFFSNLFSNSDAKTTNKATSFFQQPEGSRLTKSAQALHCFVEKLDAIMPDDETQSLGMQ